MAKNYQAILAGCGAMSGEWIRAANELGVEITGVVDLNPKAAEARITEFELGARIFTDLGAAIESVPANLLFDCTIPAAHVDVSSRGLAAGLHVLEEKPLATNLAEARKLVEAARANQRVHVVVQNRRFNKGIRQIRNLLNADLIGEVTTVNVDFFVGAHFGGFREKMDHVLLTDMAIHPFDAVRFVTRSKAETVYCEEWNPKGSWWQHGASAHAFFRMENGIRFTFRGSWSAEGFRTSWDSTWRIIGTKGTILWDGADEIVGEKIVEGKPEGLFRPVEGFGPTELASLDETRGHFSVMAQFLRNVSEGIPAETRSEDNIHSLAMLTAAIESAESGQRVGMR
jgi:predicted dehydrogenase